MIKFLVDINGILDESNYLVVKDNASYVLAYSKIQAALQNKEESSIIIRKRIFQVWFERMCQRLDNTFYLFETITLHSKLAEKWSCDIPVSITDKEINDLKLLELDEIPNQNETFNDFILRYFFDSILTKKTFEIEFFQDLINVCNPSKWTIQLTNPTIASIYSDRIELWKSSSDKSIRRLLDKFLVSVQGFIKEIQLFSVLRFYRGLARKNIKDYSIYESLKIPFNRLKKLPDLKDSLVKEIEVELNSWELPSDVNGVINFIGRCSGMVMEEFLKVEELLKTSPDLITEEVIDNVRSKFLKYIPNLKPRIDFILSSIPPEMPLEPIIDWSIDEMKEWAIKYYLPYYKWTVQYNKEISIIDKLGTDFSDWYFQHYEEARLSSKYNLFNFIPNNFEDLNASGTLDFVIIIDNFPAVFGDILKDIFKDSGYIKKSEDYYFSHIPTITEISKLSLLAGTPDQKVITDASYKRVLEEGGWLPFFGKDSFKYYPSIGKLKEESNWEAKVYFINYLLLDELLHKSEQELGSKHKDYIEPNLRILIGALSEIIERNKLKEKARVHIISDHGSTYLKSQNPLIPQTITSTRKWEHYSNRFIELASNDKMNFPPDVVDNSYFLEGSKIGTTNNYIVAKGTKSLFKQHANGWSHGGMQPEEVMVPHMIFVPITVGIIMPYLVLQNDQFRFALQNIDLELVNPNDKVIEQVYISIHNSNFESEASTVRIEKVGAKSKNHVQFFGKLNPTKNEFEKQFLKLGIEFEIEGQQFSTETDLKINLKSMIETKGTEIFDEF